MTQQRVLVGISVVASLNASLSSDADMESELTIVYRTSISVTCARDLKLHSVSIILCVWFVL